MDIKDLQEQAYKRGYADGAKDIRVPTNCGNCGNYDREKGEFTEACGVCRVMNGGASEYKAKPLTNADRIRAMIDEELCKFLAESQFCDICEEGCDNCTYNGECDKRLLEWLKQPAEE